MTAHRLAHALILSLLTTSFCIGEEKSQVDEIPPAQQKVTTALRFELDGDNTYRNLTLRAAIREDNTFAPAHWHLGEVAVDDRWTAVEQAMEAAAINPTLTNYTQRRDQALGSPEEMALAKWCRANQLADQEKLHLYRVLTSPATSQHDKAEAAQRLDLREVDGQLLTPQQMAVAKERSQQLQKAFKRWTPQVAKWRKAILGNSQKKRDEALQQLAAIRDPLAIPALEMLLSTQSEELALLVVDVLDGIPHHDATMSLVRHALGAPWPSVAQAAAAKLKDRPIHGYLPALLANLETPIQTAFQTVGTGDVVRQQQVVYREGLNQNQMMIFNTMAVPYYRHRVIQVNRVQTSVSTNPDDWVVDITSQTEAVSDNSATALAEQQTAALVQMAGAKAHVARENRRIARQNERSFDILEVVTDNVLPRQATSWWDWWQSYNEVTSPTGNQNYPLPSEFTKPTAVAIYNVLSPYEKLLVTQTTTSGTVVGRPWTGRPRSCFVEGTLVWTETGKRPIETVVTGDRVYSQDADTGELRLQLVLDHTLRPASPILWIETEQERIACTKGHPFWVNGTGWKMAKLIREDDCLHGIHGSVSLSSVIDPQFSEEAHNLVIDGFATFFVGETGILVHDNIYRSPTQAIIPGYVQN